MLTGWVGISDISLWFACMPRVHVRYKVVIAPSRYGLCGKKPIDHCITSRTASQSSISIFHPLKSCAFVICLAHQKRSPVVSRIAKAAC
jgi:hypothetical protein